MSNQNDEKHLSSIAKFVPWRRSVDKPSINTSPAGTKDGDASELSYPTSEQTLISQLSDLIGTRAVSQEELALLYIHRHLVSLDDAVKALGYNGKLKAFLDAHKCFCVGSGLIQVKLAECQKTAKVADNYISPEEFQQHAKAVMAARKNPVQECSPTDAGDDIIPTFVNFDDFTSASSDSEASDDCSTPSPRSPVAAVSMFSVMTLLHFRASVCDEDDLEGARYSAQVISELPPMPSKCKGTTKARTLSTVSTDETSWRATPQARTSSLDETSWRQALPVSSADSWVAKQKNRNSADDENVTRAARSILNKLTVEKFDSLFEQLTTCGINQPHQISILMREIFEKATTQHHFIPMYADLCVQLEKDPRIVSVVEEDGQHNFRRLLLNECQSVFEQVLESRSGEDQVDEDTAFRRKQRALGNMKLIGKLLVHGMLSSDLFVECCEELLRKHAQCPEALEALVALMTVAGPKFDKSSWQYHNRLQKILADMGGLTKDKSVPPRLRFLIRDVLDARDAGWPNSTIPTAAGIGPSKLEEVRSAPVSPTAKVSFEDPKAAAKDSKEEAKSAAKVHQQKVAKTAPWKSKKQSSSEEGASKSEDASKVAAPKGFQVVAFRHELGTIFNDLASDRNIPAAVQRVRMQQVPVLQQAEQFVDILTRIVEERRGAVRRCELAFIAGLAAAESSAFERKECLAGIGLFFRDVYPELCNEVHRLPAIMKSEFLPTMLTVLPAADLNKVVPTSMRK